MLPACIINEKTADNKALSRLLNTYCPQINIVGTATDVEAGFTLISRWEPSLVFLDVAMDGARGFDMISRCNLIPFEVILISAYDQYAVKPIREHAVACLPEPADIDELKGAVIKAEQQLEYKQRAHATFRQTRQHTAIAPSKISIPVLDGYIFVNSEDIVRCEGAGSYSWFYMADGKKIMVSLRLKECEDMLREHTFFRLHRSHIVNTRYIARYTRGRGGHIELVDGSIVDVAPHKKDAFLELMRTAR